MTEKEIIKAIVAGGRNQEAALRALYAKGAEFRRHFMSKGRLSLHEAEDLLQDTIVKIFGKAQQFTGHNGFGDGSANAWMWSIARNGLMDFLRARKSDLVSIDDDSMETSAKHALDLEIAGHNPSASQYPLAGDCVAIGVEEFAAEHPDRARALEMQMDGQSIESIAATIGRTVAATKEFLSQCKKKLAPFIQHCRDLLAT